MASPIEFTIPIGVTSTDGYWYHSGKYASLSMYNVRTRRTHTHYQILGRFDPAGGLRPWKWFYRESPGAQRRILRFCAAKGWTVYLSNYQARQVALEESNGHSERRERPSIWAE